MNRDLDSRFNVKKLIQICAFALCSFSWLLLMPLGVGPDDNWNITMNYCAQGDREGLCQDIETNTGSVWNRANGPSDISKVGGCFRQNYQLSAMCSDLSKAPSGATANQIRSITSEKWIASLQPLNASGSSADGSHQLFMNCNKEECELNVLLFRNSNVPKKIASSVFSKSRTDLQLTFTQAVNARTLQFWQDDKLLLNFKTNAYKEKAEIVWNDEYFQVSKFKKPLDSSLSTIYPAPTYSPPFYFAAMSWLSTQNVELSVWAMRSLAALVVFFMLIIAAFLTRPKTFRLLLLSLFFTGIPMGFFLFGTNNPSLWAWIGVSVTGALAYDLGFKKLLGAYDHMRFVLSFTFVAICAASRADSAIYSMLGVFIAVFISSNYKLNTYVRFYTLFITASLSLWVYFNTQSLKIHASTTPGDKLLDSAFHPILESLGVLFGNFGDRGPLGAWGLSWYDSPNPTSITYLTVFALIGLVAISLQHVNRLHFFGTSLLIASTTLFLLRGLIATSDNPPGGFIQPRYLLPMLSLTLMFILFSRNTLQPQEDDSASESKIMTPRVTVSAALASLCATSFGLSTLVAATRFGNGLEVRRGVWLDGLHSLGESFDFVGVGYLFYRLPEVSTFFSPVLPNFYFVALLILTSSVLMWFAVFASLRSYLR
jgi:hypothetical protein